MRARLSAALAAAICIAASFAASAQDFPRRAITVVVPFAAGGVTDQVAKSLSNNYPDVDWTKMIDYKLERMANHGARRAAEMEQVAATLTELGIAPLMTQATVARQREMGELGKTDAVRAAKSAGGTAMLDAVNKAAKAGE